MLGGCGWAVRLWPIDRRLWVQIPPMAEINFCRALSLCGLLSPFGKMITCLRLPWPFTVLRPNMRVYFIRRLVVVGDITAIGLKTMSNLPEATSKHTGIAYTSSPLTKRAVYAIWCALREATKSPWLRRLENAKFTIHEKWNNYPYPYATCRLRFMFSRRLSVARVPNKIISDFDGFRWSRFADNQA